MKKVTLSVTAVVFVAMVVVGATIERPDAAPPGWTHSEHVYGDQPADTRFRILVFVGAMV